MRLYHQLMLFVLAATMIPLLIGFIVLHHNEKQLENRLLVSRTESANRLSEVVHRQMKEILERIKTALGYFSIETMTAKELKGFLGLLYKQSEDITQAALLDREGKEMVAGVYLDHPDRYPEYAGRLGVNSQDHARFIKELPITEASSVDLGTVVMGMPRPLQQVDTLGFSLVVPWSSSSRNTRFFICLEVSLARIIRRVVEAGDTRGWQAELVGSKGRVIAHPESSLVMARTDVSNMPAVKRLLDGELRGALMVKDTISAFSSVPEFGWGVIISQSRNEAWAEVRSARLVTVIWTSISILALLFMGGLYTGRITRNLRKFVSSAEAFGRGDLEQKIEVYSKDELGVLANTFNQMGKELKASREEIESWNRELSQRVDERTCELEQAHQRLMETSKLAAIGQLGAGVAHEINNPLVGILGNVQLLMLDAENKDEKYLEILKKIETSSKRCREVTQNLLRFSEQDTDPYHKNCDLKQILMDAFSLIEQQLKSNGIETHWHFNPDTPKVLGDHRQLMQVFHNLFANARTAMSNGGKLIIATEPVKDDQVEIRVEDTGKGIAAENLDHLFEPFFTTKDVWTNTGLGLSLVYRIVSDHGGNINVESKPGKGSIFRVILPTIGVVS